MFLLLASSLDCWECKFASGPKEKCLTSTKILGIKKRCTNTQPACSTISAGNFYYYIGSGEKKCYISTKWIGIHIVHYLYH